MATPAADRSSGAEFCSLMSAPREKRRACISRLTTAQLRQLVKEASTVLRHLKSVDLIIRCLNPVSMSNSWALVRAEILFSDCLVDLLKAAHCQMPRKLRAAIGRGVLLPHEDGLPGLGHSQTWAWIGPNKAPAGRP
jgi:hypothetical protein